VLFQNRYSERQQECFARKMGNGIVTQSEESITPNEVPPSIPLFTQGSWNPPPEEAVGARSAIEDTRLS